MSTRQLTGRKRTYTMAEHGADDRQGRGDFILQPGVKAETWRPSWDHPTTIRIYPALSPDEPTQWDPYRFRSDHPTATMQGSFGDWVRSYPAMRQAGIGSGVTFLLNDKLDRTYNINNNPAWVLYRALADAEKANTIRNEWRPLLKGSVGKSAQLPMPSSVYIVQGAIMEGGGTVYADLEKGSPPRGGAPEDLPVVFVLSRTAGEVLMELLNERIESSRANPDDFENYYVYGDPVSLEHGRYVTFFQEGKDPRTGRRQPGPTQSTFGASATQHRDSRSRSRNHDFKSYDAFIEKDWYGCPAQLNAPELEQLVRSKVMPWETTLQFMTDKEQASVLARAFAPVPDMIIYAFRDHPEWIPEDVRNVAASRVGAAVPQGQQSGDDAYGMPVSGTGPGATPAPASVWGRGRPAERAAGVVAAPGMFGPQATEAIPPTNPTGAVPSGPAPVVTPAAETSASAPDPDFEARKAESLRKMAEARAKLAVPQT